MPTPAIASPFTLDRSHHWSKLSSEDKSRQEAILEFLITEANYHQRLLTLHEVFYHVSEEYLNSKDKRTIFQNLDELLLYSGLFLSDLQNRQVTQRGVVSSISDIFLNQMKNFECFRTYCMGHEEASHLLQEKLSSNRKFANYIKEAVCDPRCCNLDLASFLLEPVQRLARYPLLLKQILHFTEKSHTDHGLALEAVMESESYLQQVNESVREYQSRVRLAYLQNRLLVELEDKDDVGFELVGTTRKNLTRCLLVEGPLWKCKSKRKLYGLLLTDMLILLESQGSSPDPCYSFYHPPLSIDEIVLRNVKFDTVKWKLASGLKKEYCFEILRGSESICVATESLAERQKWIRELEKIKMGIIPSIERLALPCIGTVRISLISGCNIPCDQESYCVLELNDQRVEFSPSQGPHPVWNQSKVLCMASFDDILRISLFNYRKYAPNELLGFSDLSLNFLEYYNDRSTDPMSIDMMKGGTITSDSNLLLVMQFRPV